MNILCLINTVEEIYHNSKVLLWRTLLTTFIIGLLAHGAIFLQYFYNHDSVLALSSSIDNGQIQWKIILGRFMQPAYYLLRGHLAEAWLIGILSLLWISISNLLIIKIFNFKSLLLQCTLCGLIVTNQALTYTNASCIHESDTYALALLFSLLTVYVTIRFRKAYLLAPFFLFISLGLYQAYLAVTMSCFAILLIQKLLHTQETKQQIGHLCKKILYTILTAGILYHAFTQSYFYLLDIETRKGTNDVNSVYVIGAQTLAIALLDTYRYFFSYLIDQLTYHVLIVRIINGALLLFIAIRISLFLRHSKRGITDKLLLILLVISLPSLLNLTYFLSKGMHHELMGFSLVFFYVFCATLLPQSKSGDAGKLGQYAIASIYGFICLSNIIYSNHLYLLKRLIALNDQSMITRIIADIEETPQYIANQTPVLFVGTTSCSTRKRSGFEHLRGYSTSHFSGFSMNFSPPHYIKEHLNYPIRFAEHTEELQNKALSLPSFPHHGYCQMIDGTLFVKLSL